MKPTKAMIFWCRRLKRGGFMAQHGLKYDMAGRMRTAGLIEIVDRAGSLGWPYSGWDARLTDKGELLGEGRKS